MTRIPLRHVVADRDRHGNTRYYFRKRGKPKIRLPGLPGSAEFMAAYDAAFKGVPLPQRPKMAGRPAASPESLNWLVRQHYGSVEYKGLGARTRQSRRAYLEAITAQPLSSADTTPIGTLPFAEVTSGVIKRLVDRKADTPAVANKWRTALKVLFGWAAEAGHLTGNPTTTIKKIAAKGAGWHAWTEEEVGRYEAVHPIGTKARLALALLLYTGQRREDIVHLGKQHIKDGVLRLTQNKNRERRPVTLEIPVLPELQRIIAATQLEQQMTFLVTKYGRPYTGSSFYDQFKQWCREAGIPHCSPHGLRKAGATFAAEGGATAHQLMSMFGWATLQQAEVYTRCANQKRMAAIGMPLIAQGRADSA